MQTCTQIRLLVVRLGAMGDILHALPAVTALRRAHPAWAIDWLVEARWRALLEAETGAEPDGALSPARPLVNRLHLSNTRAWRKEPFSRATRQSLGGLRAALRAGEYHAVLDLQGALRSAVLGSLTGSLRHIGEEEPRERPARWFFTERVRTAGAHVIEQDLELAAMVAGDLLKYARPLLPVDARAEEWAEAQLPAAGPPAVLLNPGAGWGAKRWPVERYAAVAEGLLERGCRVVVNAGPGEEPLAEAIEKQTGGAARPVSCSLEQLIALTRRIALAVAGDTGPLHLACALGKPVVGIYGPTDPSRNGPYGTQFRVLRSPESRRDHTRRAEPEAGLLTIEPADALRAACALLYPEEDAGIDPAQYRTQS
ncbi:MAG: glycosyltransferase family 9 protein [Terracidiphilus sp.]